MKRNHDLDTHCSFCGKNQDQVDQLIGGPGRIFICSECATLCGQIIAEEHARQDAPLSAQPNTDQATGAASDPAAYILDTLLVEVTGVRAVLDDLVTEVGVLRDEIATFRGRQT